MDWRQKKPARSPRKSPAKLLKKVRRGYRHRQESSSDDEGIPPPPPPPPPPQAPLPRAMAPPPTSRLTHQSYAVDTSSSSGTSSSSDDNDVSVNPDTQKVAVVVPGNDISSVPTATTTTTTATSTAVAKSTNGATHIGTSAAAASSDKANVLSPLPPVSSLPPSAPTAPATILGFEGQPILCSPIGYYCCKCKVKIGTKCNEAVSRTTLYNHFKTKECYKTDHVPTLANELSARRSALHFVCTRNTSHWYKHIQRRRGTPVKKKRHACACSKIFRDATNLKRHLSAGRSGPTCAAIGEIECYLLLCNNFVECTTVDNSMVSTPLASTDNTVTTNAQALPLESTELPVNDEDYAYSTSSEFKKPPDELKLLGMILKPYQEQPNDYISYFATLHHLVEKVETSKKKSTTSNTSVVGTVKNAFSNKMKELVRIVTSCDRTLPNNNPALKILVLAGKEWLDLRARVHSLDIDATTRVMLNTITAARGLHSDDGERVKENDAFVMRKSTQDLKIVLTRFICFALHTGRIQTTYTTSTVSDLLDTFGGDEIATVDAVEYNSIVPNLVCSLFSRDVASYVEGSPLLTFLAAMMFNIDGNGELKMISAHRIATLSAAFLHVIKLAYCTKFYKTKTEAGNECTLREIVARDSKKLTGSITFSQICSHITRARELDGKRFRLPPSRCDNRGNVHVVDGLTFRFVHYSRWIPRLFKRAKAICSKLFLGVDWKQVLAESRYLNVEKKCTSFEICFPDDEEDPTRTISSSRISVNTTRSDAKILILELYAIVELAITALGGGAIRHTETIRLVDEVLYGWLGDNFYYYAYSIKNHCVYRKRLDNLVQHVLPRSMSGIALLFFACVHPVIEEKNYKITEKELDSKVFDLVREDFNIPQSIPITFLHLRHFIAGVTNVMFPEDGSITVANQFVTTRCMHTHGVATSRYPTMIVGAEEAFYDKYHSIWGESDTLQRVEKLPMLEHMPLEMALQHVFGHDAKFRSQDVKDMYEHCLYKSDRDALGLSFTGSGKSFVCYGPAIAYASLGLDPKCTIIVSPHKSDTTQMSQKLHKILGRGFSCLRIGSLTLRDVNTSPELLQDHKKLPHLLVVSIDALNRLIEVHWPLLQNLDRCGKLRYFIVDEIHTMISENFRTVFDCLKKLSLLLTPKLYMTATLPKEVRLSMISFLRVEDSCNVVGGNDYTVPDISISVEERDCNKYMKLEDQVFAAIETGYQDACTGFYVICATVKDSINFAASAKTHLPNKRCACFNRDTTEEQKELVTNELNNEKIDVLFTTYDCALDGPNIEQVIFAGCVRGLSSFNQGGGRIRPHKWSKRAKVLIIYESISAGWRKQIIEEEELNAKDLVASGKMPDEATFHKYFGTRGVERFLTSDSLCRMSAMMSVTGATVKRCSNCDVCNKNNPRMQVLKNRLLRDKREARDARDAKLLLDFARDNCPYCSKKDCIGLQCCRPQCLKCMAIDHSTYDCVLSKKDRLYKLLSGKKVCIRCFCYTDYSNCELGKESIKTRDDCVCGERIKNLFGIIARVNNKYKAVQGNGKALENLIIDTFASKESYNMQLAQYKRHFWQKHNLDT